MISLRALKPLLVAAGLAAAVSCLASDSTNMRVKADIWADNWFALYDGEKLIFEDSVKYLTERSFNAESFEFDITLPAELSLIIKDYKEDDTGLEYLGTRRQQIGDGGFIGQFFDADNRLLAVSDDGWRCIAIHQAPLNKSCERDENPSTSCQSRRIDAPDGWRNAYFDDTNWSNAVIHSANAVRPHGGYTDVRWQAEARLIWTEDLEIDNTILCRFTLDSYKDNR